MVHPISLSDLEEHAENVYEAIVVIAKRARQINDEQKRYLESQMDLTQEEDEMDTETFSTEAIDQAYLKMPKPTRVALEEMLAGKLKFEYLADDASEQNDK